MNILAYENLHAIHTIFMVVQCTCWQLMSYVTNGLNPDILMGTWSGESSAGDLTCDVEWCILPTCIY